MKPNFLVDVNVLLPIWCHIGSGMPYLRIFVEDVFRLLGTITVSRLRKLGCGRNKNISNDQVKFAEKSNIVLTFSYIGCGTAS